MRFDERVGLVLFLAAVTSVFAFEGLALLREARARLRGLPAPPPTPAGHAIHALAVLGVLCILYGAFVEPYRLVVTRLELPTAKLARPVRIVQLTDTHCDLAPRLEDRVVETANALAPDLVVFTGDSLNDAAALPKFKSMMSRLVAPSGKFACLGNYDVRYWRDLDLFSGTGTTPLSGTVAVSVGSAEILLAGFPIDRCREAGEAARTLPAGTFSVLLFHTPDIVRSLGDDARCDLVLAGHTHGGQVALPLVGAVVTFTSVGRAWASGRYDAANWKLYVSRGLGMEGGPAPRVRFLAPPELVCIDLVPQK